MFRTALILLAFFLAACASEQARTQPAPSPGWPKAATPIAISCDIPGPKPRDIMVPYGGNPFDFCPAGAMTIHPPVISGPPPADAAEIEMQANKEAQMQLDAIAAKLQNKTPEQSP